MNPILDQLLVFLALAAAVGYLGFRQWKKRASGKNCTGGCCSVKSESPLKAAGLTGWKEQGDR